MKKVFLLLFLAFILLISCSQKSSKELKISTNPWVGYAPLYYAQKKGYLNEINMKLITNVSLAESTLLYNVGKVDMITATQHEYYSLQKNGHKIVPIILLDRSDGGDMVLSNKTIPEIQKASKIQAYLEIDSINAEIIEDFLRYYKIDKKKIEFINKDQAQLQDIQPDPGATLIVVTYSPYDVQLKKNGFFVVASTKEARSIFVIDAIFTNTTIIKTEKQRLIQLKQIIDHSIDEMQQDTEASYKLVKGFLENISYNEYLKSLKLIKWINKPSKEILRQIKPMGFDENNLIQ